MLDHISFVYFIQQMAQHPVLLISVLLTLGVIFVNGWTDAPNAIATCVSTRCIDVNHAIIMAAICNFFGVMVMSLINSSVAMTIKNMVNFGGNNEDALIRAVRGDGGDRDLGDRSVVFRDTDEREPCADRRGSVERRSHFRADWAA